MFSHFLRYIVVLLAFVVLATTPLHAQEADASAPAQTFAQWFRSQTWSQDNLDLLNEKASIAYQEVTGSPVSVEDLISRNTFYWYWPDFEAHALSLYPANNLACVIANASYQNQIYYLEDGVDDYFVSTIFHENIHSDVFYETSAFSESFNLHLDFIEYAYGFDVRVNGNWDYLQYFEEAFADYSDAYIMRQIGFEGYYEYGISYQAGVELLAPVMETLMDAGVSFQRLYQMHSESDIENIFFVMGQVYGYENGLEVNTQTVEGKAELMLNGYTLAMNIHNAIANQMIEQSAAYTSQTQLETTAEPEATGSPVPQTLRFRPTCQMWLRFSQQQYMDINRAYVFQPDDFHQEVDGNWYILEEDYYAVIDRP